MAPSLVRAYLLATPSDDPRPDTFSVNVIDRVITPHFAALRGWLQYRVPDLADEVVMECARFAITEGRGDAFAATLALKNEVNWPADVHLCQIFINMCTAIPVAIRHAELDWQMRTGIRFPGEKGDEIEWYDETNRRFTGVVESIDKDRAVAHAQPIMGAIRTGTTRRVFAERVTSNRSRIIPQRTLGFRVDPPAEGASA